MARNAAQEKRVVMVLPAQEFLILVQLLRDTDIVASRAELRRPQEWFEEGLLVKFGLRFDQLLVDVLQHAVGAVGKGIMDRLVDGVVRVALRAVDMGDRVTGRARDARLR